MRILKSAIRTSRPYPLRAFIVAAVVTAALPAVAAAVYIWLFPSGCDLGEDASSYRWTCLLPGLLIVVPVAIAGVLLVANVLNSRSGHRYPDGWLVTILAAGLLTQVLLIGSYLFLLGPAYRSLFLGELMLIPQPFVAGAIPGAVFWLTLHLTGRPGRVRPGHGAVHGNDGIGPAQGD